MVKRAFPFSCSNTVILIFQSSYFLFSSKERWCQRLGCYLFPSHCPTPVLITSSVNSCSSGGAGSARARPAMLPAPSSLPPRATPLPTRHQHPLGSPPKNPDLQKLMEMLCKWRAGRGRRRLRSRGTVPGRHSPATGWQRCPAQPSASPKRSWKPSGEQNAVCVAVRC